MMSPGNLSTWLTGLLGAVLPPLVEVVRSIEGGNDFNPASLLLSLLPLAVAALVYVQAKLPQATWTDPPPKPRAPRQPRKPTRG